MSLSTSLRTTNSRDLAQPGKRSLLLAAAFSLCFSPALLAADGKPVQGSLTAAQIVDKHVAARGGLQAWHAVQALSLSGRIDAGTGDADARALKIARNRKAPTPGAELTAMPAGAGSAKQVQLPFVLDMKRPRKSHLEIQFAGKTAIQVFDGSKGWKLRPYLNRNSVEPFSADEAKAEVGKDDFDGPLVDYAAKGNKVELEGREPVSGHDAYKLKVTLKSGTVQHVWIDAQSFLDVKIDGVPRRMDGKVRNVWVYQSDFRPVQGVMIPFVLETVVDGYPDRHKMVIDKAALNPKFDDTLFAKPGA